MKAAYLTELGGPEQIRYAELPEPGIGPCDVLVEVRAVAVNPVDTFVRSGRYPTPTPFPFVVGRDLLGTVARAGPGASGFRPGDRVWSNSLGHGGRQGPSAQYATVAADRLYRLPDGVDDDAVAVLHPAATAWLALFRHGGLRAGDVVYVGGGAGNVGDAAVRLAAGAGARVLATARAADLDRCRAAGADVALDYRAPDLLDRLREAAPDGVDLWIDTSGHNDLGVAMGALAFAGRIVLLAGLSGHTTLPVGALYTADRSITGFAISNATSADLAAAARAINRGLATGTLPARIAERLSFADAARAHRAIEDGTVRGRLVLRPPPPHPSRDRMKGPRTA